MYDLIGDIHGHAEELIKLLTHLGYVDSGAGYQHPSRQVIFLGDFIDRGEELIQHRQLMNIVMSMVNNGHALSVMGNHEFNALAYHTSVNGKPLREHTEKNTNQHLAFLNEYEQQPIEKQKVLDFFFDLPLWLDLEGLRVVHACWDDQKISELSKLTNNARIDKDLLAKASVKGSCEYEAIEVLLKGFEVRLREGVSFKDKDNNPRDAVRTQWWKNKAVSLGDIALPVGLDIGVAALQPIPDNMPIYASDAKPCFIGHYWLSGDPAPLSHNVACLDYSIAKQGYLVAYQWDGEQILSKNKFTSVNNS